MREQIEYRDGIFVRNAPEFLAERQERMRVSARRGFARLPN